MYTSSLPLATASSKSASVKKLTIAMIGVALETPVAPAAAALTQGAGAVPEDVDLLQRRCGLLAGSRAGLAESDPAALSRHPGLRHSRYSPAILVGEKHLPGVAITATVVTIAAEPAKANEARSTTMPTSIFVRLVAACGAADKHSPSFPSARLKTTAASISTACATFGGKWATPCGLDSPAYRLTHVLFNNSVADR